MAEFKGKKVKLNKPRRIAKGSPSYNRKKFEVFVENTKGNVVRVTFGDPNLEIKRDSPARRKSFRARQKCDTNPPKDKTKARYWSCRFWESGKSVSELLSG
tara:strand:- start:1393 stop:1695 length:303 start_codon:yes stop_codon:yes gene_type:complete